MNFSNLQFIFPINPCFVYITYTNTFRLICRHFIDKTLYLASVICSFTRLHVVCQTVCFSVSLLVYISVSPPYLSWCLSAIQWLSLSVSFCSNHCLSVCGHFLSVIVLFCPLDYLFQLLFPISFSFKTFLV